MTTSLPKPSRKPIPVSQQKLIWGFSAGQCAFPDCVVRTLLRDSEVDAPTPIGEVAHIHSYEDDGPRADVSLTLDERNSYPNLILLCPNHHTLIDKRPDKYTAPMIKQWKRDVEKRIADALRNTMPQIHFAELMLITGSLSLANGAPRQDLSVIPPAEKLKKNQLSIITHAYLAIALARADVVRDFIGAFTRVDESFSSRLRAGFIAEYERLKAGGLIGDELFQEMLSFAAAGRTDLKSQAAGLAMLGYYFEACEVFEK